jgi:hypothetical protein
MLLTAELPEQKQEENVEQSVFDCSNLQFGFEVSLTLLLLSVDTCGLRTHDLLIAKQTLSPAELMTHK